MVASLGTATEMPSSEQAERAAALAPEQQGKAEGKNFFHDETSVKDFFVDSGRYEKGKLPQKLPSKFASLPPVFRPSVCDRKDSRKKSREKTYTCRTCASPLRS